MITARDAECVEHPPRWLLRVRGSALQAFDARLPLWVHPPASWLYLMPDPNLGQMGEAAVANLGPRGVVRWIDAEHREQMVVETIDGGQQVVVSEDRWCGWSDLEVSLTRTDGNPRAWGAFAAEGREHLVVAPLAPGCPGWHTVDVESGDPGALFFHPVDTWLAERPASARRFFSRPPWLWIEGALDAVPEEQTVLYTTPWSEGTHVREVIKAKRKESGPHLLDIDSAWLGADGGLVFFGKNAGPLSMSAEERALLAGFLQGMMPARVAWLRSLREQIESLSLDDRRRWLEEARAGRLEGS